MAKLKLPDVTLVMLETREYRLARLAIEDCLRAVEFGEVVVFTDRPERFKKLAQVPRFEFIADSPDKLGWCRQMWHDVPPCVRTSHALCIQWDSWICDASMWSNEFLRYDYIGAPWWYKDGKNVGNSGFCLKSIRLMRYVADHRDEFSCDSPLEDDLLCRKYRAKLENVGFKWAPEMLAHRFAFECCRPSPTSRHFGFHALFNWPEVLEHQRLLERVAIAFGSRYIRKSYMMKALCERHPLLIRELAEIHNGGNQRICGKSDIGLAVGRSNPSTTKRTMGGTGGGHPDADRRIRDGDADRL